MCLKMCPLKGISIGHPLQSGVLGVFVPTIIIYCPSVRTKITITETKSCQLTSNCFQILTNLFLIFFSFISKPLVFSCPLKQSPTHLTLYRIITAHLLTDLNKCGSVRQRICLVTLSCTWSPALDSNDLLQRIRKQN